MSQIEEARARWILERPLFDEFAVLVDSRLRSLVGAAGVSAGVSTRAKEVYGLVKKLIAKSHLNYDTMPDKVGARIIVRYRSELTILLDLVRENFSVDTVEDTSARLSVDRVGYQGIHVDGLALLESDELCVRFPRQKFFAELQLRTMSQHLWSEISHDSFYKNDEMLQALPFDLQRRVHLMAGQVEVADREFERMNSEIPSDPVARVFKSLEPVYYTLSAQKPNIELSVDVIKALLPLYQSVDVGSVSARILGRYRSSEQMFQSVYSNPDNLGTLAAAFLFQPEALMIYDCLLTDRDQTVRRWNEQFPTEELERVAALFGISLE